jgi:hypothetical protein
MRGPIHGVKYVYPRRWIPPGMQCNRFLQETSELHNNGQGTTIPWQKSLPPAGLVRQMACLNDRYALDGLSAPSYTGLLWCLGWCAKLSTGGRISTKPASGYRVGREGFQEAKVSFRETSNINRPPDTKTSRDVSESRTTLSRESWYICQASETKEDDRHPCRVGHEKN